MRLGRVLAVALVLTLTAWPSVGAAQKPLRKVVITTAAPVLDTGTAYYTSVPKLLRYWEEEGLDVEVQPMAASPAVQLFITGKADLTYTGPSGIFAVREKGAKTKAVYLGVRKNIYFPVVLEDSPIRSIKDFKGKMMGVSSYGAQFNAIFKGMFEEAGLDGEKDVTRVEIGVGPQAVTALTTQRVHIWGSWDSQIATAENLGVKLRKFTSPFANSLAIGNAFFVRDDFLRDHPDVIVGVLRGVAKASLFTQTNPDAAVKIHWQVYPNAKPQGVDDAIALQRDRHILRTRLESIRQEPGAKWGWISKEGVEAYQDFLLRFGHLKERGRAEDFYTNALIDRVNTFDDGLIRRQAVQFK